MHRRYRDPRSSDGNPPDDSLSDAMITASITLRSGTRQLDFLKQFRSRKDAAAWIDERIEWGIDHGFGIRNPKILFEVTADEQFGWLQGNEACAAEWQENTPLYR